MKEPAFVSVVVYVHNAEKTILPFLDALYGFFSEKFESFEIIIVNNASTDATSLLLNKHNHYAGTVSVITTPWKHDVELAMLAGTTLCMGDFIYEIDSPQLEFPLETLWLAYKKSTIEEFDIVFASPRTKPRLGSRIFYNLFSRFSPWGITLETESFRLITRRALNALIKTKERIRYRKLTYRLSEFPNTSIYFQPTKHMTPTQSFFERISLGITLILSFSNIGLQITLFLSLFFLCVSVSMGVYALSIYSIQGSSVAVGWTTTILFLSFGFSGIFFILTILGKYLTSLLEETREKPLYITRSIKRLR